jgi:hypothetical protein
MATQLRGIGDGAAAAARHDDDDDEALAGGSYAALAPSGGGDYELQDEQGADPLLGWAASQGWVPGRGGSGGGGGGLAGLRARLPPLPSRDALAAATVALLALIVLLLGADLRIAARSAPAPTHADPSWLHASPPPPPPPPLSPPPAPAPPLPPGGAAPLSAWEAHLSSAGYAPTRTALLTLWWRRESGDLLLQADDAALHTLFLVNAEVSSADGRAYLLRQPLGDAFWRLARAPDGLSLDVRVPPLDAARVADTSTLAPAAAAGGLASGWAYTLLRYSGGDGLGTAAAADDVSGVRSSFYLANDFLLSRFALADVLDALDAPALSASRLAGAAGHPRNLELALQGRANGSFVGVHLSVVAAPAVPMPPRLADGRAGFFATCFGALGASPPGAGPQQARRSQDARACVAHRWRLTPSPASPSPCGAPPRAPCIAQTPITYHLDPSIPDKWARCFAHGVTSWDAAFSAAGWAPGAIRALRPGDPSWPVDYDAGDIRYSSITFAPSLDSVYAVGPSTVDPRSGEILNADIMFAHAWVAWFLGEWHGLAGGGGGTANAAGESGDEDGDGGYARVHRAPRPSSQCFHHHGPSRAGGSGAGALFRAAGGAAEDAHDAHGVHDAHDAPPFASPFARVPAASSDDFVCEALAEVVAHEVGHTLGLRHNFAGSAAHAAAQLSDAAFVAAHGTSASVMDYLPPVMPSNRSAQAHYFSPVVGAYDKWAIAVGYTPAAAEVAAAAAAAAAPSPPPPDAPVAVPGAPPAESGALLSRAGERLLAFCTDDDDPSAWGGDARCSTYDLSSDTLSYFRDRTTLATAAAAAAVASTVAPASERGDWSDAYDLAHTLLHTSSVSVAAAGRYAAKTLGSVTVSKAAYGQVAAPCAPAPAAAQRDALAFIATLLVGDVLYVPRQAADAMTQRGWRDGGARGVDADALGVAPAPFIADARAAKRAIMAAALAPWRGDAMARAAWAAGGDGVVDATEVVDALAAAVWGGALTAVARRCMPQPVGGDAGGGGMCPEPALVAAAVEEMRAQDGERRATQRMWRAALRDAAGSGSGGGGDTAAAARAAGAEADAALACVLVRSGGGEGGEARQLRMHLLALLN